jgi:hypothetical protein
MKGDLEGFLPRHRRGLIPPWGPRRESFLALSCLTGEDIKIKISITEGGEVDEMDVPSCNPLLDLWLATRVLSKTLNCPARVK